MLNAPRLDDRQFQNIVDEAKKRIPHYLEEWTDHNVSDPGVTLIELFAWMTDMILYRMNRMPQRHYIKFMEMLGIRLREPIPAEVPVTFWLSAALEAAVTIPAGTEVATVQTETEPSTVFTTNEPFVIQLADLKTLLSHRPKLAQDVSAEPYGQLNVKRLESYELFSAVPQENDALYFGFGQDLSHHVLELNFECGDEGGIGVDPTQPPYVWEAAAVHPERGIEWHLCDIEIDRTKGLTTSGRMQIHLPAMSASTVNGEGDFFWVRLRLREKEEYDEGMTAYQKSPRINGVTVATMGGTIETTHAQAVSEELLGVSDGSAGQRYLLEVVPILPRQEGEGLLVQYEGGQEVWREVIDFADCGKDDKVYMLDSSSGELRLGPAVRQDNGDIKLYGAIPPRLAVLKFSRYRHGGGQMGNVAAGSIRTLKTSIPFIGRVNNRRAAEGGLDEESLEDAMMRAPALLRTRERAVTESDFEFFAQQALQAQIGRVKCLQPRPSEAGRVAAGQVYVLVVPHVIDALGDLQSGYIEPEQLEPSRPVLNQLRTELNKRRLLTTRLDIRAPAYHWVAVRVECRPSADMDDEKGRAIVSELILKRLYRFLNPLTGGVDGQGWSFGRELYESDVYQCLQGIPHVQFVRNVDVYTTTPGDGAQGQPVNTVEVVGHGTIASGIHEVAFV